MKADFYEKQKAIIEIVRKISDSLGSESTAAAFAVLNAEESVGSAKKYIVSGVEGEGGG